MKLMIFEQAAIVLLFFAQNGCTIPVEEKDEGFKYEEYVIEHEISTAQAKNSVLSTSLKSMLPPPGCHECTPEEIRYCLGRDLINDHCCCDYRYHELLPFIPHTCYVGTRLCQTVVSNCDEYRRLNSCCCRKHAFLKWRAKSGTNSVKRNTEEIAWAIFVLIYHFVNRVCI